MIFFLIFLFFRCVTFIKVENVAANGEVAYEELPDDSKTNVLEPIITIKSRSGRVIKRKQNIYFEDDDSKRKTSFKNEIKTEVKVENPVISIPKKRIRKRRRKGEAPPPVVHRCCMCQIIFESEHELMSHVPEAHSSTIEFNSQKKYTTKHKRECVYCKQKFRMARSLILHVEDPNYTEPGRDRKSEYQKSKQSKEAKQKYRENAQVICTICGKMLSDSKRLEVHELSVHAEEFPILCPHPGCGKRFAAEVVLKIHLRTHGEKKHICDVR